jgi:hypothetical protein
MGNTGSKGGTGRDVRISDWSSSKCSRVPQYADRRVWALKELYKVKDINEFPPQIYGLQDAEADIRACAAGQRLPSSWKVVSTKKLESVKGTDLRRYALQKYHGYSDVDARTLSFLPYSKQNAARDVAYYKKYRMPYFTIDKLTSTVRSRDGKISRIPGQKGTELNYKYDRSKIDQKGKITSGKKKYDVRKFPLQSMKDGSVGRVIPCSVDPSMCTPGQTTFISRDVSNVLKRAAVVNAKQRKQTLRALQTTHSKKIAALDKKIAAAPPEVKGRLQKQRQDMQLKFRLDTAKAEQQERVQIGSSKSNDWKKKRAELGRQKQHQKVLEKAKKKREEAERRAAAERKARENAAIREQRKKKDVAIRSQQKQKKASSRQASTQGLIMRNPKSPPRGGYEVPDLMLMPRTASPAKQMLAKSPSPKQKTMSQPKQMTTRSQPKLRSQFARKLAPRYTSSPGRMPYSRIRSGKRASQIGPFG